MRDSGIRGNDVDGSQDRPRPRVGRPQRPLDPGSGPVAQLAWELRELRARAGSPGYRALAKTAHYAASTLAEAAKGDRLPTLEVTLAYVRACGGDAGQWEARWRAAAQALEPVVPGEAPEGDGEDSVGKPPCPYPGLTAYTEQDAELFFGRRELVKQTVLAVEYPGETSLTTVFRSSGSGKSANLNGTPSGSSTRAERRSTSSALSGSADRWSFQPWTR